MSKHDPLQRVSPRSRPAHIHDADQLHLASAAYLARFTGISRDHTESDLRCYLTWCAGRGLDPLAARRPHLELYIQRMQEVRRFKPSTVSRRFSVVAGFYRTCVIDGLLEHAPAEHVRRPAVPAESPTLGLTHLQFEALLTAARQSANPNDFALVAMLGLLGLRISEATGAGIADLGEEHGHRLLRVCGKGSKVVLVPLPPAVVPPGEIRQLRDYTRLSTDLTRHWARLEKLLEDALIKVPGGGQQDRHAVGPRHDRGADRRGAQPRAIADLARGTMKARRAALIEALTGRFDDHHAELARMLLDQIDALTAQIDTLTARAEELIAAMPAPTPSARHAATSASSRHSAG